MFGNITIKTTRQQLYEEVWKDPVYKVAMKYGLSDVGLAKVCNMQPEQCSETFARLLGEARARPQGPAN